MILPKYKPKDIPGYEGLYGVTKDGKVYSFRTKKFLKPAVDKGGYLYVCLTNNKTKKTYLSHRLVALTYIPNPNNYPQVNHKDENKQNNHVSNLEWCTNKYNINYGTGIQRRSNTLKGENNYNSKKVRCIETGQIFNCERCANEFLGKTVKNRNISACCRGERKTSYGYHWEYIEGERSEAHI